MKNNKDKERLSDVLEKQWKEANIEEDYREAIRRVTQSIIQIDGEVSKKYNRQIVDNISSRIKSSKSMVRKLQRKRKEVTLSNAVSILNDIAGVCVVCSFCDDVYRIARGLKGEKNYKVLKIKDYIKKPKESGYQSIHLIIEVFVEDRPIRVEVQIRTVAMNYWAKLDHQLCYKRDTAKIDKIYRELQQYASEIADIDKKMLKIRKKIEVI